MHPYLMLSQLGSHDKLQGEFPVYEHRFVLDVGKICDLPGT